MLGGDDRRHRVCLDVGFGNSAFSGNEGLRRLEFSHHWNAGHRRRDHLSSNASLDRFARILPAGRTGRLECEHSCERAILVARGVRDGRQLLRLHFPPLLREGERQARYARLLLAMIAWQKPLIIL